MAVGLADHGEGLLWLQPGRRLAAAPPRRTPDLVLDAGML